MNRLLCATMLAIAASPVIAGDEPELFPEDAVKAQCAEDWPGDFFMQKGCIDLQRESFNTLTDGVQDMPEAVATTIVGQCTTDWRADFFMRKGCIDLQADSWRSLNN